MHYCYLHLHAIVGNLIVIGKHLYTRIHIALSLSSNIIDQCAKIMCEGNVGINMTDIKLVNKITTEKMSVEGELGSKAEGYSKALELPMLAMPFS